MFTALLRTVQGRYDNLHHYQWFVKMSKILFQGNILLDGVSSPKAE